MPKFNISVREFLERSKSGMFDYMSFADALMDELDKINKKYYCLREVVDIRVRLSIQGNLQGLPISVKDSICTKGIGSFAGSKILEGYVPPFDATAVARAKQSGAIVIGKTNQDEFGFGTFCTNCAYGTPKNPLDPKRVCGGSSGGAAALTAALDMPHVAVAQSTGGSISCPAAWCGVVGLTPTYGLVSRWGLIDYANSLDKIGAIGKTVYDASLLLSVMCGKDPKDSTSLDHPAHDYTQFAGRKELHGIKVGIPKEYFAEIDSEVEKTVWQAIKRLESLGASCKELSLPLTKYALPAYYIIATAEASTNLAKFCGLRYGMHAELKGNATEYFSRVRASGFGEEAKRRVMLGTFARMAGYKDAYYTKAMQIRTLIIREFKQAFKKCDLLAAPTMPILPPKFDDIKKLTPAQVYQMDMLTVPANLAGLPMISVPAKAGTPIGLHLIGDHTQEPRLIEVGAAFEQSK
ncbi:MAG: amidase family protein [Candidatus Aenigmatarchaeota archaeon]